MRVEHEVVRSYRKLKELPTDMEIIVVGGINDDITPATGFQTTYVVGPSDALFIAHKDKHGARLVAEII